jgi:eukaryotic-like serine/threonine-protein kinase
MPDVATKRVVRFGLFEANLDDRLLTKGGIRIRLQDQPFKILVMLLERPGEVLSREEIRQRLWPENTYVEFDDGLNTAIRKLRAGLSDSADNPRYIETVPRRGYRFLAAVENGGPTVSAVSLGAPQHSPAQSLLHHDARFPAARQRRVGTYITLGAMLVLLVLLVANFRSMRGRLLDRTPRGEPPAQFTTRPAIAVLGFKNLSGRGDEVWISTALSEMLGAELASGQQLRVIPGENVARMKLDLSLPAADSYAPDTLNKIRNNLSTDIVVLGSYLALGKDAGGKIRIDVQLQDTRTGDIIAVVSRDGTESDLGDLVSESGAILRQKLGIGNVPADFAGQVLASVPTNPEAVRLYAEGLVKLQVFDALGARDLLQKAIAADPNHALSHSALAESWSALGYDTKAQLEAKKALDLSANLSRGERLSIEGRYKEFSHELPAAIEIYRTLRNFFPDDLNYALRLANAQVNATAGNDALQTIALMRKLPPPINRDARIDLAESSAADALSDFPRSQRAAAAAAARAQEQGSPLLVAAAEMREAIAWNYLGDLDRSLASYTQARKLWIQGGNSRGAGAALHGIANAQCNKGDFVASRKAYEIALQELRRLGAMRELASCTHNFGVLFNYQGDLLDAKKHFEEALRIQRQTKDERGVASDLDDLGNVLMDMGDLAGALRMKQEARQSFHRLGNKFGESVTLFNTGEVLLAQGQLPAARQTYEEAKAISQQTKEKRTRGYCLLGLAKVLAAQDRLADARAQAQESIDLREEIKDQATTAESRIQLAKIVLEQGSAGEAESLSRAAIAVLEQQKAIADGAESYAVLAHALLAKGKNRDAQAAVDRALSLARQSGDVIAAFEANFAAEAVAARSGRLQEAARILEAARAQANRQGFGGFELEARLHLGELELRSGKVSLSHTHLEELQNDARSKGFLLIARKAKALQSARPLTTN